MTATGPSNQPTSSTVPPAGRELQRIAEEVRQDLLDAAPVAGRGAEPRRKLRSEAHGRCDRDRRQVIEDALARSRPPRTASTSRLRLPDSSRDSSSRSPTSSSIESTIVAAALEELALDGRVVDVAGEDQLEVPAEAGQRRAQLVGDRRHEPVALGVPRAQQFELALGGELVGDSASATAACRARPAGKRASSRPAAAASPNSKPSTTVALVGIASRRTAHRGGSVGRRAVAVGFGPNAPRQDRSDRRRVVGSGGAAGSTRSATGARRPARATRRPGPSGPLGAGARRPGVQPGGQRLGVRRVLVGLTATGDAGARRRRRGRLPARAPAVSASSSRAPPAAPRPGRGQQARRGRGRGTRSPRGAAASTARRDGARAARRSGGGGRHGGRSDRKPSLQRLRPSLEHRTSARRRGAGRMTPIGRSAMVAGRSAEASPGVRAPCRPEVPPSGDRRRGRSRAPAGRGSGAPRRAPRRRTRRPRRARRPSGRSPGRGPRGP